MELGAILIGLAILTVSLLFLLAPFKPGGQKKTSKPTSLANSAGGRTVALAALRDLDFDFKTGKISEEDYPALRAGLLVEAAQQIQQEETKDSEVEALIQARRRARGDSSAADCPYCGKRVRVGDLFCTACGRRLEVQAEPG